QAESPTATVCDYVDPASLCFPTGLATDPNNDLYVVDHPLSYYYPYVHSRVIQYPNTNPPTTSDPAQTSADAYWGVDSLTTTSCTSCSAGGYGTPNVTPTDFYFAF